MKNLPIGASRAAIVLAVSMSSVKLVGTIQVAIDATAKFDVSASF
jgi:hypothetical protein